MSDGAAPDEQELAQHIEQNEEVPPADTAPEQQKDESPPAQQEDESPPAQPEENEPATAPLTAVDSASVEKEEKETEQEPLTSNKDEAQKVTKAEEQTASKDQLEVAPSSSDNKEGRKSALTDLETLYIAHLLECCDAGDGFDIFQLLAIGVNKIGVVKNNELEERNKWIGFLFYFFNAIKGVMTGATQVIGISIIMVDFVRTGLIKKYGDVDTAWEEGICNTEHDEYEGDPEAAFYRGLLALLSFLFCSFLAFFSMDHLLHTEKGMYKNLDYAKHLNWINSTWLRIGFLVNVLVSIISVYGAFVVIFFSDDALDMVLNSVALFFIVELDDLLVNPEDYQKIEKYLENKKYKYMVMEADDRKNSCGRKCCNNLVHCCGWFYLVPFQIVRYITVVLCVIAPFVVAYCY